MEKKKILVVEDESSYRDILLKKLDSEGFEVFGANDAEKGFSEAILHKPDLILLDLGLPKEDGISLFRKIRHYDKWGENVPVFILSALSSSDEERHKAIVELVPTYYLHKSDVSIFDLIDKIKDKFIGI